MACEKVKRKIYHLLKNGYFNDEKDFVDVSDGDLTVRLSISSSSAESSRAV